MKSECKVLNTVPDAHSKHLVNGSWENTLIFFFFFLSTGNTRAQVLWLKRISAFIETYSVVKAPVSLRGLVLGQPLQTAGV